MAEDFNIIKGNKEEQYHQLYHQIKALLEGENDFIANAANICAALKTQFNFLWVGFYLIKGEELVLGPFQGPVACTRILKGKGVCGTSWLHSKVYIIDDVDLFDGHIACSSLSKSEIVLPLIINNEIVGVLDVDSEHIANFNKIDEHGLLKIISLLN